MTARRRLPWLACAAVLAGCGAEPRSFREASLAETRELLATPSVSVVEAIDAEGRGFGIARSRIWRLDVPAGGRQPEIADGPVLVVGVSPAAAHRSAAALARAGHEPVWVFVPATVEDREALRAPPLEAKEKTRGEGS